MATLYSYTPTTTTEYASNSGALRGQLFTLSTNATVEAIQMKVYRVGADPDATLRIYATSGGLPTGAEVYSQVLDTTGWSTSANVETFTLDTPQELTAGTYAAAIRSTESPYDYATIQVYMSRTADGAGTGAVTYSGGSWAANNAGLYIIVTGTETAHTKTTNPTPANTATEVDWDTPTLSWSGTGNTYTVYIARSGGGFVASDIVYQGALTTTTLDSTEKAVFADLTDVIYWRVDSTVGSETLTGDTWTFDPRPGQASSPTPTDTGSNISLSQTFSWTTGTNGTSDELVIAGTSYYTGDAGTWAQTADIYDWYETGDGTVSWRVDTSNYYGTTTGASWTFTPLELDHLRVSYTLITGGSGNGPYDGGVEGTDFWYTGLNNVITVKRLVVFAKDAAYIEELN